MAASRDTLNGPDWRDVAAAMEALQSQLEGYIELTVHLKGRGKFRTLTVVARLFTDHYVDVVPVPLALASVSSKAFGAGDFSQALLSALYELDKEVYRQEIGVSPIRR